MESTATAHKHFATNENKGMLWKLLVNGSIFNGISDEYVSNIRGDFEKKISELNGRVTARGYSLMELNKTFISEMTVHVETFKDIVRKTKATPSSSNPPQTPFQTAFEKKKEDFNSLLVNKPPVKVDFSDKLDEAIGEGNIESILAETIARRERELNFVLDKPNTNTTNTTNAIKIGDVLEKGQVLNVKQVRFSDKVEMREHINVEEDSSDSLFVTRNEYAILFEKIDGILRKSQRDVLDVVNEMIKSKQV